MLRRTTDYTFNVYGRVYNRWEDAVIPEDTPSFDKVIVNRDFTHFQSSDQTIYIQPKHGIALLVVSLDGKEVEEFVLHRITAINPKVLFHLVSISESAYVQIAHDTSHLVCHRETFSYRYKPVITHFFLQEILACFYQIREPNYIFPGEVHEYYELTYVDQGCMDTVIDGKTYHLNQFDAILYYPGQHHTQQTDSQHSCAYLTIIFRMDTELASTLRNTVFHTKKNIFNVLRRFMNVMETSSQTNNELSLIYLKELLILLHQREDIDHGDTTNPLRYYYENTLLNEIILYIRTHLYQSITVDELCHKFGLSRSSLQTLFNENLQVAPKKFIIQIKMRQAKRMIQENERNISEISDALGFNSIHYFSRQFKQIFGQSPTEYAKSIQQ